MGKSFLSRQKVHEIVESHVVLEGSPDEIRQQLQRFEDAYGKAISIHWNEWGGSGYAEVHKLRDEDDAEMYARIKRERAAREQAKKQKASLHEAKVKQYEKLKKELGL